MCIILLFSYVCLIGLPGKIYLLLRYGLCFRFLFCTHWRSRDAAGTLSFVQDLVFVGCVFFI